MRGQNRISILIILTLAAAAAFMYFNCFADRGRRIVSQPREILPRGDLADFEKSGIGFAVPVDVVNRVVPKLITIERQPGGIKHGRL